jgi:hypothetical protein
LLLLPLLSFTVVVEALIWRSQIHYSARYSKKFIDNSLKKIVQSCDFRMTIIIEQSTYTYDIKITFSYLVGANLLNIQQTRKAERYTMILKYLSHGTWPLNIHYAPKFIKINTSLWLVYCTFAICGEKREVQNMSLQDAKFPPHPIKMPRGGAKLLGDKCPTILVSIVVSALGSKCARKHIDHSSLDHYGVSGTSYPVTGCHIQEWTIILQDCLLPQKYL